MRTGCTQNQFCLESLEGRLLLSADPALIAADPLAIASPTAEIAKLFGDASESQNLSALTSAKEAFDMFEDMGIFAPADKGDVSLTEKGSSEGSTESSEAKTAKATTAPAPSAESSTSEVVSVAPESQTGSKATELMAETLKVANPPPHVVSTVTLFGAPDWRDQGPGPISSAGSSVGATFAGAINGIAADAFNANLMFVATVNGGVWRSMNATATTPQWTTATDQFPSFSMGSV